MPYLSASAVVFHVEEALYQVYAPLPFTFTGAFITKQYICTSASWEGNYRSGVVPLPLRHGLRAYGRLKGDEMNASWPFSPLPLQLTAVQFQDNSTEIRMEVAPGRRKKKENVDKSYGRKTMGVDDETQ